MLKLTAEERDEIGKDLTRALYEEITKRTSILYSNDYFSINTRALICLLIAHFVDIKNNILENKKSNIKDYIKVFLEDLNSNIKKIIYEEK